MYLSHINRLMTADPSPLEPGRRTVGMQMLQAGALAG